MSFLRLVARQMPIHQQLIFPARHNHNLMRGLSSLLYKTTLITLASTSTMSNHQAAGFSVSAPNTSGNAAGGAARGMTKPKPKRGNSRRPNGHQQKRVKNTDANSAAATAGAAKSSTPKPLTTASTPGSNLVVSDNKFSDLPISAESRRALAEVFKYDSMTPVQSETLPLILEGYDCLAKAKTGTGKTLGFLVPAIERIVKSRSGHQSSPKDICCLIISPARELAFQIENEAASMLTFHKGMKVMSSVGGTNIGKDNTKLKGSIQMMVATPGRLLDHLQNNGLAARMNKLDVLILDEADQLLDQGFRPDIERILALLKPSAQTRQTLLFSATVPKSVTEIASIALRQQYKFVDTVGADTDQTHLHVKQEIYVTSQAEQIAAVAQLMKRETSRAGKDPYKVIVFFTTARLTGFYADLFRASNPGYQILDIHSRKSQPQRKKASDAFRDSKQAILFSSDVSARGMDYPDVTYVLQVGLTERAQYIHRLGRTARAGKEGKGGLLLAHYEERHMKKELSDMPLEHVAIPNDPETLQMVNRGLRSVGEKDSALELAAKQAYGAWLGYYKGNLRKCGWNTDTLVQAANTWAKDSGLQEQPRLQKKTVGKMGLKGVPGILLEEGSGHQQQHGSRQGGGQGRGGASGGRGGGASRGRSRR